MFNIGSGEMVLLGALFFFLFGPQRLPEIARAFGQALAAFQQHSRTLTAELTRQMDLESSQHNALASVHHEDEDEDDDDEEDIEEQWSDSKPMVRHEEPSAQDKLEQAVADGKIAPPMDPVAAASPPIPAPHSAPETVARATKVEAVPIHAVAVELTQA